MSNERANKWNKLHRVECRKAFLAWKKRNPKKYIELNKKHNALNKIKLPLQRKAWRKGYTQRDTVCRNCSNTKNLEFHHTDYKLEKGFTLCKKCHSDLHKGENK
jgi:hypothetical protein